MVVQHNRVLGLDIPGNDNIIRKWLDISGKRLTPEPCQSGQKPFLTYHRNRIQLETYKSGKKKFIKKSLSISWSTWVSSGKLSNLIGQMKLICVAWEYITSLCRVIHSPACFWSTLTTLWCNVMKCNECKIYCNHLEGLEVIDKDVGQPEQVDQLQVDRDQSLVTLIS